MPTFQTELMREARHLARLQRTARTLRANLKRTTDAIRHSKKTLRVLANAAAEKGEPVPYAGAVVMSWPESGAASKVFGTAAGAK